MNREPYNQEPGGVPGGVVAILRCVAPRNNGSCGRLVGRVMYFTATSEPPMMHLYVVLADRANMQARIGASDQQIIDLAVEGLQDVVSRCPRHGEVGLSGSELAIALKGLPVQQPVETGLQLRILSAPC